MTCSQNTGMPMKVWTGKIPSSIGNCATGPSCYILERTWLQFVHVFCFVKDWVKHEKLFPLYAKLSLDNPVKKKSGDKKSLLHTKERKRGHQSVIHMGVLCGSGRCKITEWWDRGEMETRVKITSGGIAMSSWHLTPDLITSFLCIGSDLISQTLRSEMQECCLETKEQHGSDLDCNLHWKLNQRDRKVTVTGPDIGSIKGTNLPAYHWINSPPAIWNHTGLIRPFSPPFLCPVKP